MQIFCCFVGLIVVAGFISFAVIVDPREAHNAPYPFAAFFAGLTAFGLAILGGLVASYVSSPVVGVIIMLMAPTVGLLGGGLFGYRLGLRRRQRANDYIEPQMARRNAEEEMD